MKKIYLLILMFTSVESFARDVQRDNYLFRDGMYSPVYGEVSTLLSSEYGGNLNAYLNVEVGIQAIAHERHALLFGYNKRGFHHGHVGPKNYKLSLDGPVVEYIYKLYPFIPMLGAAYLVGGKKTTLNEQSELIDDITRFELRAMLSYRLSADLGADVVIGYVHSWNTISESKMQLIGAKRVNNKDVGGTIVINEYGQSRSRSESYLVGIRFNSY